MEMENKKMQLSKIISGTLLVTGTTIGAGMLGIPLLTVQAGFWPACLITICTFAFMLCTGLLFLEVTLWMPPGSNLMSISERFFGKMGKWISGAMFVFLYYCLLIAYFAAGAPLMIQPLEYLFGFSLLGVPGYFLFALIFASIVWMGTKWIDRSNLLLTLGMIIAYVLLIGIGIFEIDTQRFSYANWKLSFLAAPILFSAFGFHNVIPSLCTYLGKERKTLQLCIIIGVTIPLVVYLIWQALMIGAVPKEQMELALQQGLPATAALQTVVKNPWVYRTGQWFAFFAIVTSLLGVALSMVDFLADGLKIKRKGISRLFLSLLTFVPPFLFASIDPTIFDKALGVAGGFGEAILNGLIPIALAWVGRYAHNLYSEGRLLGGKLTLITLFLCGCAVMILEIMQLVGIKS